MVIKSSTIFQPLYLVVENKKTQKKSWQIYNFVVWYSQEEQSSCITITFGGKIIGYIIFDKWMIDWFWLR